MTAAGGITTSPVVNVHSGNLVLRFCTYTNLFISCRGLTASDSQLVEYPHAAPTLFGVADERRAAFTTSTKSFTEVPAFVSSTYDCTLLHGLIILLLFCPHHCRLSSLKATARRYRSIYSHEENSSPQESAFCLPWLFSPISLPSCFLSSFVVPAFPWTFGPFFCRNFFTDCVVCLRTALRTFVFSGLSGPRSAFPKVR